MRLERQYGHAVGAAGALADLSLTPENTADSGSLVMHPQYAWVPSSCCSVMHSRGTVCVPGPGASSSGL